MQALGIDTAHLLVNKIEATIFNPSNNNVGNIVVTFNSNWNSSDGPYLEFDETIRGFGLYYRLYNPRWVSMNYHERTMELAVRGADYEFVLSFAP